MYILSNTYHIHIWFVLLFSFYTLGNQSAEKLRNAHTESIHEQVLGLGFQQMSI